MKSQRGVDVATGTTGGRGLTRPSFRRLTSIALASLAIAVASACSEQDSDPAATDSGSWRITGVESVGPRAVTGLSPTGGAYVYLDGADLCAGRTVAAATQPVCVAGLLPLDSAPPEPEQPWRSRLSWSADEQRVVFADTGQTGMVLFDLNDGDAEVVIEPKSYESATQAPNADVSLFFGPNETPYFFRQSDGQWQLWSVDGAVAPVDGATLPDGWWPESEPIRFGEDAWVFGYQTLRPKRQGLATLTFDGAGVTFDELSTGMDDATLVDAADGRVLLAVPDGDPYQGRSRMFLFVPERGSTIELETPDTANETNPTSAFKFSPDGRSVIGISHDETNPLSAVVWQIGDNGIETTHVDSSVAEFPGSGIGTGPGQLAWDGDAMLTAVTSEGDLVSFDIVRD